MSNIFSNIVFNIENINEHKKKETIIYRSSKFFFLLYRRSIHKFSTLQTIVGTFQKNKTPNYY